jgi:hypothetical protein
MGKENIKIPFVFNPLFIMLLKFFIDCFVVIIFDELESD